MSQRRYPLFQTAVSGKNVTFTLALSIVVLFPPLSSFPFYSLLWTNSQRECSRVVICCTQHRSYLHLVVLYLRFWKSYPSCPVHGSALRCWLEQDQYIKSWKYSSTSHVLYYFLCVCSKWNLKPFLCFVEYLRLLSSLMYWTCFENLLEM